MSNYSYHYINSLLFQFHFASKLANLKAAIKVTVPRHQLAILKRLLWYSYALLDLKNFSSLLTGSSLTAKALLIFQMFIILFVLHISPNIKF